MPHPAPPNLAGCRKEPGQSNSVKVGDSERTTATGSMLLLLGRRLAPNTDVVKPSTQKSVVVINLGGPVRLRRAVVCKQRNRVGLHPVEEVATRSLISYEADTG